MFHTSKKKSVSWFEPQTSKAARERIAEISQISGEGIPLREIAEFSELELQAIELAGEFMRDATGEITIDKAIEVATQIAQQKIDMNTPEIQGIIQEVRKSGDLALNRIGRALQQQGTLSTTAGRDILGRSIGETEKATAAALSPLLQSFRAQRLQATSLLPGLVGQKAGITKGRMATGAAAGGAVSGLQQRISDALFLRKQKQFAWQTTGQAEIAGMLLQTPQAVISGGGPGGLAGLVGGVSDITSLLGTGGNLAGGLASLLGGGAAAGGAFGLGAGIVPAGTLGTLASTVGPLFMAASDIAVKENIKPVTNALDKVEQLKGYTFNYKSEKAKNRSGGIMAQDLEKVLPDGVCIINGLKYVRYDAVVGLLVEAIKELNQKMQSN